MFLILAPINKIGKWFINTQKKKNSDTKFNKKSF